MGLKEIPVLPEDYLLFDWADWPDSRDALVKGGPTRRFESACWNAIVDTLADALEEAGVEWLLGGFEDGRYQYTVEDVKMKKDKRLKSSSMNRVIANIEQIIRFGWGWEVDPTFRGYTGFNRFREMPYRDGKDKVYPEYFIELVRHLNLMLEIMRGTAAIQDCEIDSFNVNSIIDANPVSLPAASVEPDGRTFSNIDKHIELRTGVAIEYSNDIHSKVSAKAEVVPCVIGSVWRKSNLNFEIRGNVRQSIPGKPKPVLMQSKVFADMMFARMIESAAQWLAKSIVYADATVKKSTATSAQSSSKSTKSVDIVQQPELPTSGHSKSYSEASVGIVKKEPLPTKGESVSISASFAKIGQLQALDAESSANARSGSDIRIDKSTPLPTAGEALTQSITSANIDVTEPIPTGCCFDSTSKNVILMHDAKSRPTWAEHKAISQMNASSYKARPLGTNAACKTGSIVKCALDTGWLPPVWINGGLWIRQAYSTTQNEDGSLEVI